MQISWRELNPVLSFFFPFVSCPSQPLQFKYTNATAKPAQPAKRPIQMSSQISIQPRPLIAAMPLAPAATAAPLQPKTIIIQPLQTTVLPVVKPAPISIQPAPPPGPFSHCIQDYFVVLCIDIGHLTRRSVLVFCCILEISIYLLFTFAN